MSRTITVAELQLLRCGESPVQMIDVRSRTEFASGHVPGAVNIPMEEVESRIDDLHTAVVLICKSGRRARMVAGLLAPCRESITVLDGGTEAWERAGLPLVRSARTRWSLERQVRLGAGLLVLTGVLLGVFVDIDLLALAGFVGLGLVFAGLTDLCPMGVVLGLMPWNRLRKNATEVCS